MKATVSHFLYYIVLVGVACSAHKLRIIGGQDAAENDYPYVVLIDARIGRGKSICGGALLRDNYVLTAAHCVLDNRNNVLQPSKVVVYAGSIIKGSGTKAKVQKVVVHRAYNKAVDRYGPGDIAILKLLKSLDVEKNPKIQTVPIFEDTEKSLVGKTVSAAGFGTVEVKYKLVNGRLVVDYQVGAKTLQHIETDVISNEECQVRKKTTVYPSHLCTRRKNDKATGVCYGDSGGPLVYQNKVVGIISTTFCDERSGASTYTRVTSYLDFIRNALNDEVTPEMRITEIDYKENKIPTEFSIITKIYD